MRVVIHTGPADRAERFVEAIRRAGFDPRHLPAIASQPIAPSPETLAEIRSAGPFDLVVVTSPRAAAELPRLASFVSGAQVVAVGAATGEACARVGFAPAHVGSSAIRTFLEALGARLDFRGKAVLFPRGDLATDPALAEIAGRGARIVAPVVYRTVAVAHPPAEVRAALSGAAGVTFTSGSGVRSFSEAADAAGAGPEARLLFAATMGPTTECVAQKAGFKWRGVSRRPSPQALADLLAGALTEGSQA